MGTTETTRVSGPKATFHQGLPGHLGKVIFEREFPSDLALVHTLVVRLVEFFRQESIFLPQEENKVALSIEEALMNAVVHGNQKDFKKKVTLKVFLADADVAILVKDEGKGFSEAKLKDLGRPDSPLIESGRGIHLMAHFMNRVEFFDGGRIVVMARTL